MSRHDESRLTDIIEAIEAIESHLTRGDLHDGLVYDAVRVRLVEIGEAVKGISADLLDTVPTVPWKAIARMRDHLAHRYFDTDHAIVQDVVENELAPCSTPSGPCPGGPGNNRVTPEQQQRRRVCGRSSRWTTPHSAEEAARGRRRQRGRRGVGEDLIRTSGRPRGWS